MLSPLQSITERRHTRRSANRLRVAAPSTMPKSPRLGLFEFFLAEKNPPDEFRAACAGHIRRYLEARRGSLKGDAEV
jgi:hypothetical protein